MPQITGLDALVRGGYIVVQWNNPFLLPSLEPTVLYIVLVLLGNTVSENRVSSTDFEYPLADNGVYEIHVALTNGAVTSDAAITTVSYCTSMLAN